MSDKTTPTAGEQLSEIKNIVTKRYREQRLALVTRSNMGVGLANHLMRWPKQRRKLP